MTKDSLGDRMKRYESVTNFKLTPRSCLFIRVDGRAFHTYTRNMNRPFDEAFISVMSFAARETCKELSGLKLAYVQSDECTFMLTDYDDLTTQGWFNYELSKVVSISASLFTSHFMAGAYATNGLPNKAVQFDSRAFIVPEDDAPNAFIWRYKDWIRNSKQMYARSFFSHKQLQGKNTDDIQAMIIAAGYKPWEELDPVQKYGVCITSDNAITSIPLDYKTVKELIQS